MGRTLVRLLTVTLILTGLATLGASAVRADHRTVAYPSQDCQATEGPIPFWCFWE
ncbi:hypothetical protein AB0M43_10595 [Longispora sp. NPDC051575]|uniref:hypothetical protein n=1 Tax=Longispora sp. NPDC051575 TaxID=3154943 RepID=UPI003417E407